MMYFFTYSDLSCHFFALYRSLVSSSQCFINKQTKKFVCELIKPSLDESKYVTENGIQIGLAVARITLPNNGIHIQTNKPTNRKKNYKLLC